MHFLIFFCGFLVCGVLGAFKVAMPAPELRKMRLEDLERYGEAAFNRSDYDRALTYTEALFDRKPDMPVLYTRLAILYLIKGQSFNADSALGECVDRFVDGRCYDCAKMLCQRAVDGLLTHGGMELAEKACDAAHEFGEKDSLEDLGLRGAFAVVQMKPDLAIELLDRVLEQRPNSTLAMRFKLHALSIQGKCDEVTKVGKAYLKAYPENEALLSVVGSLRALCDPSNAKNIKAMWKTSRARARRALYGFNCSSFKFTADYGQAEASRKNVYKAGKAYGKETPAVGTFKNKLDNMFEDKDVDVVELRNVLVQGLEGVLFSHNPVCEVYGGDSLWNNPLTSFTTIVGQDAATKAGKLNDHEVVSILHDGYQDYLTVLGSLIPRYLILKEEVIGDKDIPILAAPTHSRWLREAFSFLDVSNSDIIDQPETDVYLAEKMYVIDGRVPETNPQHEKEFWIPNQIPRHLLRLAHQTFAHNQKSLPIDGPWKVVLSESYDARPYSPSRQPLEDALQKLLGPDHFKVIDPQSIPLQEQIEFFSDAVIVVGQESSGLTPFLFTPHNAAMVSFPIHPIVERAYMNVAYALDREYVEIPSLSSTYYTGYQVTDENVQEVVRTVTDLLAARGFVSKRQCTDGVCSL